MISAGRTLAARCPDCGYVQPAGRPVCRRCGQAPGSSGGAFRRARRLLTEGESTVTAPALLGVALAAVGAGFVLRSPASADQVSPTLVHHLVGMANLVFHEAGHWILAPLGRFLAVAGGSLFEVAVPAVCLLEFVRRGDRNGAAFSLWWTGTALGGVAIYAADARAGRLVLLGGRTGSESPHAHDWRNLLEWTGLLGADVTIGWTLHLIGSGLIVTAVAWCALRAIEARGRAGAHDALPA